MPGQAPLKSNENHSPDQGCKSAQSKHKSLVTRSEDPDPGKAHTCNIPENTGLLLKEKPEFSSGQAPDVPLAPDPITMAGVLAAPSLQSFLRDTYTQSSS